MRADIFAAVWLYEQREGQRSTGHSEQELAADLADAARQRDRAFEGVLLLGGDDVVEAAHELNASALESDWRTSGRPRTRSNPGVRAEPCRVPGDHGPTWSREGGPGRERQCHQ